MSKNIYFTSDTHAFHKNICKGTSEWGETGEFRLRDFSTPEEMTEEMAARFNSIVKEDDTLYHLGDWSFGGIQNIWNFRRMLNCRNIHLILGNHDHHIEADKKIPMDQQADWRTMKNIIIEDNLYLDKTMYDLFNSVEHYKEISFKIDSMKAGKYGATKICMFHYAMSVWNQSHHQTIHLYGHSHGSLPDRGNRSMDIGVDTNNLYPYHLDEIMMIMKDRRNTVVDHHTSQTN